MFDPSSRYHMIEDAKLVAAGPDGEAREIPYRRRRFIPQPEDAATLARHDVVQGDRLDTITARYLGDPTHFWRICDANLVFSPLELTDEPGASITIPLPTH